MNNQKKISIEEFRARQRGLSVDDLRKEARDIREAQGVPQINPDEYVLDPIKMEPETRSYRDKYKDNMHIWTLGDPNYPPMGMSPAEWRPMYDEYMSKKKGLTYNPKF